MCGFAVIEESIFIRTGKCLCMLNGLCQGMREKVCWCGGQEGKVVKPGGVEKCIDKSDQKSISPSVGLGGEQGGV